MLRTCHGSRTRRTAAAIARFYRRFRLDGIKITLTFPSTTQAERFVRDVEQRGTRWTYDTLMVGVELKGEMTLDASVQRHLMTLTDLGAATLDDSGRMTANWPRLFAEHRRRAISNPEVDERVPVSV